jgi:hypothetical protein
LCYRLAGLATVVDENFVEMFKKGTTPEQHIDQEKLNHIKKLAGITIEKLRLDVADNIFSNYTDYTTSYNVSLSNIEDAIKFVSVHEGLHLGYAMALRRLLQ